MAVGVVMVVLVLVAVVLLSLGRVVWVGPPGGPSLAAGWITGRGSPAPDSKEPSEHTPAFSSPPHTLL